MSDDLTPEEREALKGLPRERMPGPGLESRVVGAMREHGFLTRRRRVIELTNSRVAGVLAASVALMIGAYSLGRLRGGERVVPIEMTAPRDDRGPLPMETGQSNPTSVGEAVRQEQESAAGTELAPQSDVGKANAPSVPPVRSDEAATDRIARQLEQETKRLAEAPKASGAAPAPTQESATSQGALHTGRAESQYPLSNRSLAPASPAPGAAPVPKRPLTFMVNGTPVHVEAPDSVRVTQDERGTMLLIYTSDGVIRIYLGNRK